MKEPKLLNRTTGYILLFFFWIGIAFIIVSYIKFDMGLRIAGVFMSILSGIAAGLFVSHDILAEKFNKRNEEDEL